MSSSIKFTNRFWLTYLAIFGFWTIIAILELIQIYIRFNPGRFGDFSLIINGKSVTWIQWGLVNISNWYILAFFTPFIFELSRRFPFGDKIRRWRVFFTHFLLSFLFSLIFVGLEAFFSELILADSLNFIAFLDTFINRLIAQFHLMVAAYWAIAGVGFAIDYYRRFRERESQAAKLALHSSKLETQLIKAQLDSLKMQLHPHFLFNTLHTISALIDDNPNIARDMIADLSELLRVSLDTVEKQTISLKKEVEITKLYLDIEQLRFKEKLKVDFDINQQDLGGGVPSFILQPLVENAIKHGITGEKKTAKLQIKACRLEDTLEINVKDNGKGFSENQLEKINKGIGLSNTKSRLEQLYGDEHKFVIENSKDGGAIVTIVIPYIEEDETDGN